MWHRSLQSQEGFRPEHQESAVDGAPVCTQAAEVKHGGDAGDSTQRGEVRRVRKTQSSDKLGGDRAVHGRAAERGVHGGSPEEGEDHQSAGGQK